MKLYNCTLTKSVWIEADNKSDAMTEAEQYDWKQSEPILEVHDEITSDSHKEERKC
jgi:hypothetical protein